MNQRCSSATAVRIIDFEIKPEKRGNAEIDAAPMMQNPVVKGMDLYSPPSSEPLQVPVLNNTAPIDMNRRAL